MPETGTISLSPAKQELVLSPGSSALKPLNIKNAGDQELLVTVRIEDFGSGNGPNQVIKFLGEEAGTYSLKNYLTVGEKSFRLLPDEEKNIPLEITVPQGAVPGGRYGGIIFSLNTPIDNSQGAAKVVNELASLFFLKIPGEVREAGELTGFGQIKLTNKKDGFYLSFTNEGNIYLNPYGVIKFKNKLWGIEKSLFVDPWFILPESTRLRELPLEENFGPGYWQAEVLLNRGYGDIVDSRAITFWVIPTSYLVTGATILLIIVLWFSLKFIWHHAKI